MASRRGRESSFRWIAARWRATVVTSVPGSPSPDRSDKRNASRGWLAVRRVLTSSDGWCPWRVMSGRKTILDVVLQVVGDDERGATAAELHERILARQLYEFRAKDPVAVLRAAIRKHLKASNNPRIRPIGSDRFRRT